MQLINLSGLALIGPGSEWFWSMLQFVIVAITLYAIYRQVRLQASTSAIDQVTALEHDWDAEGMARSRLAVLQALRDGVDPSKVPADAAGAIAHFWERVGYLVATGHIEPSLVWEYFSNSIGTWWAWLTPYARASRERFEVPGILENFERLASEMAGQPRDRPARSTSQRQENRAAGGQASVRMGHRGLLLRLWLPNQQPRIGALSPSTT
jgi:hypothetical protein